MSRDDLGPALAVAVVLTLVTVIVVLGLRGSDESPEGCVMVTETACLTQAEIDAVQRRLDDAQR